MLSKQVEMVQILKHKFGVWQACVLICMSAVLPLSATHAEGAAYLLQPGDILQVSVWKEPDLQGDVLVRPDGGISFPLAGDLQVSGLSVSETAALITSKIEHFIPDPVVSVSTKQIGGNHVYVIGKVGRPGEFSFINPLDVMQALSLAGGATPYASVSNIVILRRVNGKQIAIPFDYSDVEEGKALNKNIVLLSGDTVVVP